MNNTRTKRITALVILFLVFSLSLFAAEGAATRRFGIFIGSNNGGWDRVTLRYAVSDARSVSKVFSGMGGISAEDAVILVDPTVGEINRVLENLGRLSAQARRNAQRTELVFYYSGHSDEDGILLNRERYGYRELRERINSVEAEMKIVIIDSCSSGAITRAKGGVKTQPFLFDSSVSAEGFAFLTSSSDDEVSQESDSIQSSYFTHSLLAGLRGAADSIGDGRVTLNELYRYAYTETLAQTETSTYGPQHPSYDIQISGSGDVVLTDIKEISASLLIAEDITGRISIRDSSDFLIAELTKVARKPLELGLEPGRYRITLQRGDNFFRAEITLPENRQTSLNMASFSSIAASSGNRRRGTGDSWEDDGTVDYPVNFQAIPIGFNIFGGGYDNETNHFLIGIFVAKGNNLMGFGLANLGLINTGYVRGIQTSGIFNILEGPLYGIQVSGIFNITNSGINGIQVSGIFNKAGSDVHGMQASGIFNYAGGDLEGLQAAGLYNSAAEMQGLQAALVNVNSGGKGAMVGLVNISGSEDIVPIGLVNLMKNGIKHPAVFFDDMLFTNISFRSGSKRFYSILSAGAGGGLTFGSGDTLLVGRFGFGFEYQATDKLYFNVEGTSGNIFNIDRYGKDSDRPLGESDKDWDKFDGYSTNIQQLRLIAGYNFLPHLGVFAGVSYDYLYRRFESCPDPKDFGGPVLGSTSGRHTHKLGFFGGLQF